MGNVGMSTKSKPNSHKQKLRETECGLNIKPLPKLEKNTQHESCSVQQNLDKNEQVLDKAREKLRNVTDEIRMTKRKVHEVNLELEKAECKLEATKKKLAATKNELEIAKQDLSANEQKLRTVGKLQRVNPTLETTSQVARGYIAHHKITDDDISTIKFRVTDYRGTLFRNVMIFQKALKSDVAEKTQEELADFFVPLFQKSESGIVRRLLAEMPVSGVVSCLVQKYIAEKMCEHFFDLPVCHDEDVNDLFLRTEKLLRNSRQMSEEDIHHIRLFMVKARTFTKGKRVTQIYYEEEVEKVICELVNKLKFIYDIGQCNICHKIRELVKVAADLSLCMRGQRDKIVMQKVMTYDPIYEHQVELLYSSTSVGPEPILLSIFPIFFRLSFDNSTDSKSDSDNNKNTISGTYLEGYKLLSKGNVVYR